jgi:hypothetical protein
VSLFFCVLYFLGFRRHVEGFFLWVIVAFVDAQLPLGFDAASFARVFAPD